MCIPGDYMRSLVVAYHIDQYRNESMNIDFFHIQLARQSLYSQLWFFKSIYVSAIRARIVLYATYIHMYQQNLQLRQLALCTASQIYIHTTATCIVKNSLLFYNNIIIITVYSQLGYIGHDGFTHIAMRYAATYVRTHATQRSM